MYTFDSNVCNLGNKFKVLMPAAKNRFFTENVHFYILETYISFPCLIKSNFIFQKTPFSMVIYFDKISDQTFPVLYRSQQRKGSFLLPDANMYKQNLNKFFSPARESKSSRQEYMCGKYMLKGP